MLRRALILLALILPLPAFAAQDGFRFAGASLEAGGFPGGSYSLLSGIARAGYSLGWGELAVDLSLSAADAQGRSLTAAEALFHLSFRPVSWVTLGPYVWLGSQSNGGGAHALGVEALVSTPWGVSGELYFGETRGGVLGDGYATNKGLRLGYQGKGRYAGFMDFSKDTVNLAAGDQDFYRLALGVDTWIDLSDKPALLTVSLGQHHFDQLDIREDWVSVGVTVPLNGAGRFDRGFGSRRGVTHRLPMP